MRAGALGGAGAIARGGGGVERDLYADIVADSGLPERDGQIITEIGSLARPVASAARGAAHAEPEKIPEYVAEVGEDVFIGLEAALAVQAGMAEAIITRALVGVAQNVIRLGSLLELGFRFLIARVSVRVILHGEFPVGLFNLFSRGCTLNAQNFVLVAPDHGSSLVYF